MALPRYGPRTPDTAWDSLTVTASATPFYTPAAALELVVGGDVTVTTGAGESRSFTGLPDGHMLVTRCTHMTATTSTNVIAHII